jgi:hypothetical protein
MKEKLIKTLDLKNGLQLKIYDASRNLVGDRWLVSLIARMEIPVSEVLERNDPQENVKVLKDVLGERIMFEQKRQRLFVDIKDKENAFKEACDIFLGSSLKYLSNETFPKQFILRTYKEKLKKASLFSAGKSME